MAIDIRGDGLLRAHRALAALEEDPERLDRARTRFSDSPPPYRSHQSPNSTLSQSPNPPGEEQRREEDRRWQLIIERRGSQPYYQFQAQIEEEIKRIREAHENRTFVLARGTDSHRLAYDRVKERWVEQGIWGDKWTQTASNGVWKHELPLELEVEAEPRNRCPIFSFYPIDPQPRQPNIDEENRRITELRATREREREASRPYHQFIYQVSKEREHMENQTNNGGANATAADINTRAYENVKSAWVKRKIWNRKWGILPGMSWRHADPLEDDLADYPASTQANLPNPTSTQANLPWNRSYNPVRTYMGIFEPSAPAGMSSQPEAQATNAPQRDESANVGLGGLANGDAEHSLPSSTPTSQGPGRPTSRSPVRQTRAVAGAFLGPIHTWKVSKAAPRKRRAPQRRINTREAVPNSPTLPEPEPAGPVPQTAAIPPRRSKRLQPPEPDTADPLPRASRTASKRTAARVPTPTAPVKPKGVSKRQAPQRRKK